MLLQHQTSPYCFQQHAIIHSLHSSILEQRQRIALNMPCAIPTNDSTANEQNNDTPEGGYRWISSKIKQKEQ